MRMPFGKYEGDRLCELPEDYIEWLLGWKGLREPLRSELKRELMFRAPPAASMMEIINAGYKTLAMKYHPDVGGTNEQMKTLNASVEALRRMLGRA